MAVQNEETCWRIFQDKRLESSSDFSDAELLDFCQCLLCGGELKQPMCMPCLHRFCRECLVKRIEVEKQPILYCPVCYYDMPLTRNGTDDLQNDFLVSGLLEVISFKELYLKENCAFPANCNICSVMKPVSCYCFTCKYFLCRECRVKHLKSKAFMKHQISLESYGGHGNQELSLTKIAQYLLTEPPKCQTHSDTVLDLCCANCHNSLVCKNCAIDNHEGHEILNLFTATNKTKAKLEEDIFLLDKNKMKLTINSDDVKRKTQQIHNAISVTTHKLKDAHQKSIHAINSERQNNAFLKDAQKKIEELQQNLKLRLKSLKEKRDGEDQEVNMENHRKLVTEAKKDFQADVKKAKDTRDKWLEHFYQRQKECNEMLRCLLDTIANYQKKTFLVMNEVTEHSRNILKRCDNLTLSSLFLGATKDPWTFIQYIPILSNGIQQTLKEIEGIPTLTEAVTSCIASVNWPLDDSSNWSLDDYSLLLGCDVETRRVPREIHLNKADNKVVPFTIRTGANTPPEREGSKVKATAKIVPFSIGGGASIPHVAQDNNLHATAKVVPYSMGSGANIQTLAQGTKVKATSKVASYSIGTSANIPHEVQDNDLNVTAEVVPSSKGADANIPKVAQNTKVKGTAKGEPSSTAAGTNIPRKTKNAKVKATLKGFPFSMGAGASIQNTNVKATSNVAPPSMAAGTNIPLKTKSVKVKATTIGVPLSMGASASTPRVAQGSNLKAITKVSPTSKGEAHPRKGSIILRKGPFTRIEGSLGNEKWVLTDIASTSSRNVEGIIISGRIDPKRTFVSVIHLTGKRIYHKESTSKVSNPNCFCAALSAKKIVTICDPDRMSIFDISTDSVVSNEISHQMPCSHDVFTCLTVDLKRKRIIIGVNSKDLYEFDYAMNFCRTIHMLVNDNRLKDVTVVADGRIIACDWFGLRAFAVTSVSGSRMSEFPKPTSIFTKWKPTKVCTDLHGYIYILWMGDTTKVVAKYSNDGKLKGDRRVGDDTMFIATTNTADGVRLLTTPTFTGEIFVYDTNFSNAIP